MTQALNDKQRVAHYAANLVENGMLVGLGTGSTADCFIDELAIRKQQGLNIVTVASSVLSSNRAQQMGLEVVAMEHLSHIDIYVDGADEVSPSMALLKGRGSDLVKEKLLAQASKQFYVLVTKSKLVHRIGQNFPIPIEVAAFSWEMVLYQLLEMGGKGGLRTSNGGLAVTSHGSLVLDMTFDARLDINQLNKQLNSVSGIVEHGIFEGLATAILVGENEQVTHITQPK